MVSERPGSAGTTGTPGTTKLQKVLNFGGKTRFLCGSWYFTLPECLLGDALYGKSWVGDYAPNIELSIEYCIVGHQSRSLGCSLRPLSPIQISTNIKQFWIFVEISLQKLKYPRNSWHSTLLLLILRCHRVMICYPEVQKASQNTSRVFSEFLSTVVQQALSKRGYRENFVFFDPKKCLLYYI